MNYFSHGRSYVDRPYFVAGSAVPDWLSVIDRQVRMRARRVEPFAVAPSSPESELAAGILQHLHDDGWFHRTLAFHEVTGRLTAEFRTVITGDDARPSFLGHIVTEMVLDAVQIAQDPDRLHAYYAALEAVDPLVVQQAVSRMARQPTERLAPFIPLFIRERFLWDYLEPDRLLWRLNQVLRRVKLSPLPPAAVAVLDTAWIVVGERAAELLQPAAAQPQQRVDLRE
jgi:hypothetical protein